MVGSMLPSERGGGPGMGVGAREWDGCQGQIRSQCPGVTFQGEETDSE